MQIVIVAARDRSAINKPNNEMTEEQKTQILSADQLLIEKIITKLKDKFKNISIVSYGCDDGIPLIIKRHCDKEKIRFAEIAWFIHGEAFWSRTETQELYVSRHAALLEIGDLFLIFVNNSRYAIVENLIARLEGLVANNEPNQGKAKPFAIIDEQGEIVEGYKYESFL